MIPYGHQSIGEEDINAVVEALRSDYLTQGPQVEKFEEALAEYCGSCYAVVVSNGTAALHAAYAVAGLSAGDEFITTPLTFAATATAGLWQGARPVFVDIDRETGNIDPEAVERSITVKTKAIVPVDYTGRPANLEKIREIAVRHNLIVVEDACQALGASYQGKKIGSLSDFSIFSFHPVKTITTGEGGAILTDNEAWYRKLKIFLTHGITKQNFLAPSPGGWYTEMQSLGHNYRLTEFQCALGVSQLKKITSFLDRRRHLVERYNEALRGLENVILPSLDTPTSQSSWHLYVVRVPAADRARIFRELRAAQIGVQVHHIPVYWHPYYKTLGYERGDCPEAEAWYESAISLPLFPELKEEDQEYVIGTFKNIMKA